VRDREIEEYGILTSAERGREGGRESGERSGLFGWLRRKRELQRGKLTISLVFFSFNFFSFCCVYYYSII
jgi:hypothetical protein